MIILGIDPGIGRAGWGIIRVEGGKASPLHYGCVETTKDRTNSERLHILYDNFCGIIHEYKPDSVAIEDLFFNTNVTTAITVGQARGVILLAAEQAKLPLAVYTPLQVKMALTGYGRADKKQVGDMYGGKEANDQYFGVIK